MKNGITYDVDGKVVQYLHGVMNKDWVEFELDKPGVSRKNKGGIVWIIECLCMFSYKI